MRLVRGRDRTGLEFDVTQDSRPCKGCGELIYRTATFSSIRHYCSPDCRPRCSVAGCGQSARKMGWCASHYAQRQRSGLPPEPFKYKWSSYAPCPNCGSTEHEAGQRTFCSANCRMAFTLYGGPRPTETTCVACGVKIDLTARGKRGQLVKTRTKFCRSCRQDYDKYKLSARELAKRDGTDCGICGQPVDMSLRRADSNMCPSVDHIWPRSRGGSHEPENLQLAHLQCNQAKSDRVGVRA